MPKEETPGNGRGILSWDRACDTCGTAACAVYCLADSAYLCSACDAGVHAANRLSSRHELARLCESCERAPTVFLFKADTASLCAACNAEVHSANPLAHRHHRVPILFPSSPGPIEPPLSLNDETVEEEEEEEEDEEAASWLLMDQGNAGNILDLVEYSDSATEDRNVDVKSYGGNGVVPVKNGDGKGYDQVQQQLFLDLEFDPVLKSVHGHGHASSLSLSVRNKVSSSSMDMSVVPDSSLNDISVPHPQLPKGTIDLFSGHQAQVPVQLTGVDREARVMRYREKKKKRKFEKTIRYASRKAYAETRPRIKGRFTKRAEIDIEVDQMFSAAMMIAEAAGYGIVPSF